jgi:hypothetical protein
VHPEHQELLTLRDEVLKIFQRADKLAAALRARVASEDETTNR